MEAKVNHTVVGLTVILLSAALLGTALWLSVGFNTKTYNTYAIFLNEAATGLSEEAPVRFSGVKVGFVKKISLNHNNPEQVIILLNIEEGTPITIHTTATLISQGITGVSYIGLTAKGPNLTPLKAPKGYPYPIIPSKPSLFNQLDKAISEVSEHIGSVSTQINRVFDPENAQYIKDTLRNIDRFTQTIADHREQLGQTLQYSSQLTHNLAQGSEQLPQLLQDIKRAIGDFNQMSGSINVAGKRVSTAMDAGTSAMNKLAQQTIPSTTNFIQRLDKIAINLDKISQMMQQNPSVIIRGTAPAKPGPGER
ncbi:MAG: MCE family protein [Legionellaceae bacterium]|nr:MCE family protein [Legionellaceae bacterium]